MTPLANAAHLDRVIVDRRHLDTPILLVDDLQDNIDLLLDILEDAGYSNLHHVNSGEAALQTLERNPQVGLVLLDMIMPGLDGCETCRRISEHPATRHIPVIMVTGGSLHRDHALIRAFDAGAIDFINKPIQELELYGRVRAALDLFHERMNSARKTAELEKSEERFELAVSGTNDGLWDFNLVTGEAYLSPVWKSILGFEPDELADSIQVWESFIHPEDRDRVTEGLQRHWEDRDSAFLIEHRMIARDGEIKWVLTRGKTLWDKEHRKVRMAGSTTDISRHKHIEGQLHHVQKMDSIGRFAGGIAHDFNNSLALISAYSQVILEEPRITEVVEKYAREILNATESASSVTRQLLTLSRRSVADLQPLQLNNLLSPMGEMLRRIVGKRIAYTQTLAPDLPLILADKSMIEQIVLNLVVNARDAMTTGQLALSTFSLQVGPAEAAADKEARLGPAVCLQVADTGIGMSEQTIAHIFEPFFTTKAAGKGTGLGLSTVYSIVKQHKGWLTVKSEIDKGTTFSLYFPALDQSAVTAPSASAPSLSGHGETILLVEDEAALRGMAETILSGFNYRVLAAASGPDALQVWEKHRDEIHMLFTDIVMPQGMTGIDLAEKLLQDRPELKVIYTSGYRLEEIPRSMLIRETGHFVPKPYIPSVLARTLRQVLET